jgi:hypothetical protein
MKFLMYVLFFCFGLGTGVSVTEDKWERKLEVTLEEREAVHEIMIDVENTVTRKEAFDEMLQTLWDTCIDGGGFYIDNQETGERETFECSKEGDNDYTQVQYSMDIDESFVMVDQRKQQRVE